ncbi:helix-turn-helix domain-containing protein [Ruminiclostridium josui]|uniref:helix-turn-helix domain-containing protein n=1 Tax=Ruminiclostridium josui TaxID=1499 RepID=UPI003BF4805F
MKFQDKLQALRKEKGLSQEKLAEAIGVSRQAVAKWEVGQSYPEINKLVALSNYFGVSVDKFVKDYDDENCTYQYSKQQSCANEEIIDFLCRAKKSTYAGRGVEGTSSRLIHMIFTMKKVI